MNYLIAFAGFLVGIGALTLAYRMGFKDGYTKATLRADDILMAHAAQMRSRPRPPGWEDVHHTLEDDA